MTRRAASYAEDLVTALLGGWFTVGLMLDAFAHNQIPELETFFTWWHAVFYSGFVATAGWVLWVCRAALRTGMPARAAIPAGYGATLVAVVGFALFGVGDLIWHTVFGIERDIDILFSPTHLGLATTMLIIITTPVRSAWATRDRAGLPVVVATGFATTMVLLFLQYANLLTYSANGILRGLSGASTGGSAEFAAALFVTNLVLTVPLLVHARRWAPPPGLATFTYAATGALSAAVTGVSDPGLTVALVLCGVLVDVLGHLVRPSGNTVRFRVYGTVAPLVTWVGYFVAAYLLAGPMPVPVNGHPERQAELVTGTPVLCALVGLLLAVLTSARVEPSPDLAAKLP